MRLDSKALDNLGISREKAGKPRAHEEDDLQMACVEIFRLKYHKCLIFAIPNGGRRNPREGARLKKAGVLAGVADLFIPEPSGLLASPPYIGWAKCGLFIELKSNNGRMEDSQIAFRDKVIFRGYKYEMCRTVDNFLKVVDNYFKCL